jgi:uncharacterized protein involved in exopolysaccharide biosynthesis
LRELKTRFTPQHPDVIRAQAALDKLQKALSAERAAIAQGGPVPETRMDSTRRGRIKELTSEMDALDRRIAEKQSDDRRLRQQVETYQARIAAAPTRESELVALTRDYETLQRQYRSLLEKYEESKVAANLERKQIGEQFRILDPARVPEKPYTPNRPLIAAAGAGFGLFAGLALVVLLEYRDQRLRTPADVALCCGVEVLVAIPPVVTPAETQRLARRRKLIWAASVVVIGLTVGVAAWNWSHWSALLLR